MEITLDPSEKYSSRVDTDGYQMTPAEYVVFVFGGGIRRGAIITTASILGRSRQSICEWFDPKLKRGGRGLIPANMQVLILQIAKERGLDITANDLILGRKVKVKYG